MDGFFPLGKPLSFGVGSPQVSLCVVPPTALDPPLENVVQACCPKAHDPNGLPGSPVAIALSHPLYPKKRPIATATEQSDRNLAIQVIRGPPMKNPDQFRLGALKATHSEAAKPSIEMGSFGVPRKPAGGGEMLPLV